MQCQEGTVCHEQNGTGCLGRQGERESLKKIRIFRTLDKTKRHQHLYIHIYIYISDLHDIYFNYFYILIFFYTSSL